MKYFLLIALMSAAAIAGKSQDLVFSIDQSGQASKNVKTGMFDDAEVKDAKATIILQNDKLVVDNHGKVSYRLMQKSPEKKDGKPVVTRTWNGTDEAQQPVILKMTVNVDSKVAMIEVAHKKSKDYYFGICTSSVAGAE